MEFHENELESLHLQGLREITNFSSPKQSIRFVEHEYLGKVLIINGEIQHIEKYQPLYHEMLVHLPATFIPKIESALILGGGSLFAAYEILKYPSVKTLVLCDYAPNVLSLMETYYPHAKAVMRDPRFSYVSADAREYIESTTEKFDLMINDCFNLALESKKASVSLYSQLSELCNYDGVCVDIIYRHIFERETTLDSLRYLQSENNVVFSLVTVPEYPGILHLETIWGKTKNLSQNLTRPLNQFHQCCIKEHSIPFQFFSPLNLPFYLYLPPYIRNQFIL